MDFVTQHPQAILQDPLANEPMNHAAADVPPWPDMECIALCCSRNGNDASYLGGYAGDRRMHWSTHKRGGDWVTEWLCYVCMKVLPHADVLSVRSSLAPGASHCHFHPGRVSMVVDTHSGGISWCCLRACPANPELEPELEDRCANDRYFPHSAPARFPMALRRRSRSPRTMPPIDLTLD